MSYEDIKSMEIKNNNIIIFLIIDILFNINKLLNMTISDYLIVVFIIMIFVVTFPFISKYIGGADLKIFMLLIPIIGQKLTLVILLSSLIGLIYSIITKKQVIPFIPFISIALIILEVKYLIK